MNFQEYIEEYYENYAKNADGQIQGTVKSFVETAIQDFLFQKGYGKENAKNFVEVITGNNQKIDYSHIININEDSKLFAKVADLKVFESINKLQDFNNLLNESLGTYQLCLDLEKQMQENGKCKPEDLKNLLSVILDSAINTANAMPGSNIFALSAYQTTKEYIVDGVDFVIDEANQTEVNEFINGSPSLMKSNLWHKWCSVVDGKWEAGPSIAELEAEYNSCDEEDFESLYSYLEWRIAYEFRIELEKQFEKNNIDMTVEEYFEMMDKLTDDRGFLEKILNKLGFETDNISEFLSNNETADFIIPSCTLIPNLKMILQSFELAESEKPCTPIYSSSIFFSHILDPLILDLDGDDYNVENKENGTNFDLDKNGFAEKINWTTKDGFSTKLNVKPS